MSVEAPDYFDDLEQWTWKDFCVEFAIPVPEVEINYREMADFIQFQFTPRDIATARHLQRTLTVMACALGRHLDFWGRDEADECEGQQDLDWGDA